LRTMCFGAVMLLVWHAPVLAQSFAIEPDAPERGVAGCYAIDPPVPPRSGELAALPQPGALVLVPDTVRLTLSADHFGGVWVGLPWREAGWKLRLQPDPWPGLHSFATWRLRRDGTITLEWKPGFAPGPGFDRELTQRITATPTSDGFSGVVSWDPSSFGLESVPVTLTRVGCPGEEYFGSYNWMMRTSRPRDRR
jgi:hypothetical protein